MNDFPLKQWGRAFHLFLALWLFLGAGAFRPASAETYSHDSLDNFLPGWKDGSLVLEEGPNGILAAGERWGFPIESFADDRLAKEASIHRNIGENFELLRGVGQWWRALFPSGSSRRAAFLVAAVQPARVSPVWTWAGEGPPGQTVTSTFWQGDLYCLTRCGEDTSTVLWASTPGRQPYLFWEPFPLEEPLQDFEPEAMLGHGHHLYLLGQKVGCWEMVATGDSGAGGIVQSPIPRSETFQNLAGLAALREVLFAYFQTERGYLLVATLLGQGAPEWHSVRYFPPRLAPTQLVAAEDALYLLHPSRPSLNQTLAGCPQPSLVRTGCFVHCFDLPGRWKIRSIHWETEPPASPGWHLSWRVRPKHPQTALIPWSVPSSARNRLIEQEADGLEYRLEWRGTGDCPAPGVTRVWIETDALEQACSLAASAEQPGGTSKLADPLDARLASLSPRLHPSERVEIAQNRHRTLLPKAPQSDSTRRSVPPGDFNPILKSGFARSITPSDKRSGKNKVLSPSASVQPGAQSPTGQRRPASLSSVSTANPWHASPSPSQTSRPSPGDEARLDRGQDLSPVTPSHEKLGNPEPKPAQQHNPVGRGLSVLSAPSDQPRPRKPLSPQEEHPQSGKTSPQTLPPSVSPSTPATKAKGECPLSTLLGASRPALPNVPENRRPPFPISERRGKRDSVRPHKPADPASSIRPAIRGPQLHGQGSGREPPLPSNSKANRLPVSVSNEAKSFQDFSPPTVSRLSRFIQSEAAAKSPTQFTAGPSSADELSAAASWAAFLMPKKEGDSLLSPHLVAGFQPTGAAPPPASMSKGGVSTVSGVRPGAIHQAGVLTLLRRVLGSRSATLSGATRGTSSRPNETRAKFLPYIFQLSGRGPKESTLALSLLPLVLLLLLVSLLACRLVRQRPSFARYYRQALKRKERSVACLAVQQENRQAAENARPLRTAWVPGSRGDRELVDIMIGEEADTEALSGRQMSVQEPSRLGSLACRPLAALPQCSPEQRLLVVEDTLYLFSRGQAVFAARAVGGRARPIWSAPLALVPESGPGFSVIFFKRWFFFLPGAGHRSHTPIYRSERYTDGNLGPWKKAGEIPFGLDHHTLAPGRQSLFLLGGRTGKRPVAWALQARLDFKGQVSGIHRTRSLPAPLCPARCAVIRNQLFAWQGPDTETSHNTVGLWSAGLSADDQLSAWRCRSTLPETGGAEELYACGGNVLLIQRGHLYQTRWRAGGPLGPWRRLEGRLPRHRSVLLFSDRLYLAGSEATPSAPRRSSHALLAAELRV